jgi:hypothetical protein
MTNTVLIEKASAASLLLEIRCSGAKLASATGFVANSPLGPVLITCRHVVTGRHHFTADPLSKTGLFPSEIEIHHNGAEKRDGIDTIVKVTEPLYHPNNTPLWWEHPTLGGRADIIALPLTKLTGVRLHPSTLGIGDPLIVCRPAEPVSVVGFPFGKSGPGQFAIWATGFVASEISLDYDGLPVFLIDCRSRPGQSGAPVLAYRTTSVVTEDGVVGIGSGEAYSRFLGVYSSRIHAESDIGMVWKAAVVQKLVESVGAHDIRETP